MDLVVPGHRLDPEPAVGLGDPVQLGDPVHVDDVTGLSEPQLHQRDEAHAPGQDLRVVPVFLQQADRFIERLRPVVLESCR